MRDACYPDGRIETALAGKDATALAHAAGIRVPSGTRVLVAPFELIVPEEPLAREKLFPLLGMVRVSDASRGIEAARALLRIGGAGHSAVIHSRTPRDDPRLRRRGAGAARERERPAAAPARRAWTPISRRR